MKQEKTIKPISQSPTSIRPHTKKSLSFFGVGVYKNLLALMKKKEGKFDILKTEKKIGEKMVKEVLARKKKEAKLAKKPPTYNDYRLVRIKKNILGAIQKKFGLLVSIELPPPEINADFSIPCFAAAKKLQKNPAELAKEISAFISEKHGFAGGLAIRSFNEGGYVNLTLAKEKLAGEIVAQILKLGDFYGASDSGKNKTIVLEYSSPNIAKPMNVGHLRSTIIGNSLKRVYEYAGFTVIGINYLGDWGTQFGKLLYALKDLSIQENPNSQIFDIKEFLDLYVKFHKEAEKNPELNEKAKEMFKKLEQGQDAELVKIWLKIADTSLKEFQKIYERLGIKYDLFLGESFYRNKTEAIIKKCLAKKIAVLEKDGPVVVDLAGFGLASYILRKSDEATIYAARDLAAAEFRHRTFKPFKIIYVVGSEQTFYFKQLFKTLELLKIGKPEHFLHLGFGLISLPEGKMSTRAGRAIFLEDLFNEAVKRAGEIVESKNPNFTQKEKQEISEAVGIGSVIYSDLSQHREKNIIFNWDKALNLKGDSAPYIQYGYARIKSIIRKLQNPNPKSQILNSKQIQNPKSKIQNSTLEKEEEKIIFLLARFPEIVFSAEKYARPDIIADYLNNLVQEFNRFYENVPVLNAPENLSACALHAGSRDFRLALVHSISQVINNGLALLEIKTVEKM